MDSGSKAAVGGDGTKALNFGTAYTGLELEYIWVNSPTVVGSMKDSEGDDLMVYGGYGTIAWNQGAIFCARSGRTIKSVTLTSGNAIGVSRKFK